MSSLGRDSRRYEDRFYEDGSRNAEGFLSFGRIERALFKEDLAEQGWCPRPDGEHLCNVGEPIILKNTEAVRSRFSQDETCKELPVPF